MSERHSNPGNHNDLHEVNDRLARIQETRAREQEARKWEEWLGDAGVDDMSPEAEQRLKDVKDYFESRPAASEEDLKYLENRQEITESLRSSTDKGKFLPGIYEYEGFNDPNYKDRYDRIIEGDKHLRRIRLLAEEIGVLKDKVVDLEDALKIDRQIKEKSDRVQELFDKYSESSDLSEEDKYEIFGRLAEIAYGTPEEELSAPAEELAPPVTPKREEPAEAPVKAVGRASVPPTQVFERPAAPVAEDKLPRAPRVHIAGGVGKAEPSEPSGPSILVDEVIDRKKAAGEAPIEDEAKAEEKPAAEVPEQEKAEEVGEINIEDVMDVIDLRKQVKEIYEREKTNMRKRTFIVPSREDWAVAKVHFWEGLAQEATEQFAKGNEKLVEKLLPYVQMGEEQFDQKFADQIESIKEAEEEIKKEKQETAQELQKERAERKEARKKRRARRLGGFIFSNLRWDKKSGTYLLRDNLLK